MNRQEIFELVQKYNRGQCTPEEKVLLETWYVNKNELFHHELSESELESTLNEIYDTLPKPGKKFKLWPRIAVAIAVTIAVTGLSVWFFSPNRPANKDQTPIAYANDVAPGKNVATLTLANGKSITLNKKKNGIVVSEDLKYSDGSPLPAAFSLQGGERSITLSTPRGGTYQITLADGTKVWLNAASSLTYTRVMNERRVKLDGEAYFEVAKDKKSPFIVSSRNQEVKVLGTHFNISSYADESHVKTTLLEGSVDVNGHMLKPNQQAVNHSGKINILPADIESALSWKEGEFIFHNEDLGSIMKKVARWYDVEVYYADQQMAKEKFWGSISRFENISDVLKMLDMTGKVHFKVEGRRIMVAK